MVKSVLQIFPVHLREKIADCNIREELLEEIRIRIGQPIVISYGQEEWHLDASKQKLTKQESQAYRITESDVQEMVTFLSRYSLYAFQEEIRSGFITLEGGHRVGIAGQVQMEHHQVADIRYIRFLNIRIAKQRPGCAKEMIKYITTENLIYNTLLVSSPGVGKTTYLRDCIRMLSRDGASGRGIRISVVDERSEIAACHLGIPQNDVGPNTDVLDRCNKPEGMIMMLRSMSPQILAVDELGAKEDFYAVEQAMNCGCRLIGTVHAGSIQELSEKENMKIWMERGIFQRYIILKKQADGKRVFEVYDERRERLW